MAHNQKEISEARREFLARCGKYAVITPPTVSLLLSAAKHNYAAASSGHGWNGRDGNNDGWGNRVDRGNHGNRGWGGNDGGNRGRGGRH